MKHLSLTISAALRLFSSPLNCSISSFVKISVSVSESSSARSFGSGFGSSVFSEEIDSNSANEAGTAGVSLTVEIGVTDNDGKLKREI